MSSISALMKQALKPHALAHWTRPGVVLLTQALFEVDPMGLRGFGVPTDEYEPEAELSFALSLGCETVADLWKVEYTSGTSEGTRRASEKSNVFIICQRTLMMHY